MRLLKIETAENGFIVYDDAFDGCRVKMYVFSTNSDLAAFVDYWGGVNGNPVHVDLGEKK